MTKNKITPLNKTQGGSYIKDPKTGKRTLVNQTKPQVKPQTKQQPKPQTSTET